MKQIGDMKLYSLGEVEDEIIGKKGTSRRDDYETRLQDEVESYHLGETIKKARLEQNLTQEELGRRIGVQRAQISRIENGKCDTLSTIRRVFKALGVKTATLDLGQFGQLALW